MGFGHVDYLSYVELWNMENYHRTRDWIEKVAKAHGWKLAVGKGECGRLATKSEH